MATPAWRHALGLIGIAMFGLSACGGDSRERGDAPFVEERMVAVRAIVEEFSAALVAAGAEAPVTREPILSSCSQGIEGPARTVEWSYSIDLEIGDGIDPDDVLSVGRGLLRSRGIDAEVVNEARIQSVRGERADGSRYEVGVNESLRLAFVQGVSGCLPSREPVG